MDDDVVFGVLRIARELAEASDVDVVSPETLEALDALIASASEPVMDVNLLDHRAADIESDYERVIKPGSKGLNLNRDNEEFIVERVFLTREGLRYAGITETHVGHLANTECMPLVSEVVEIPGVTEFALYNHKTGQVEDMPK